MLDERAAHQAAHLSAATAPNGRATGGAGRHDEMVGRLETHAMVDSGGRPVQRIRYGDPVVIERSETLDSALLQKDGERIQQLAKIGWPNLSVERLQEAIALLRIPLYVNRAVYRFDSSEDGGFELSLEVKSRRQVEG